MRRPHWDLLIDNIENIAGGGHPLRSQQVTAPYVVPARVMRRFQ